MAIEGEVVAEAIAVGVAVAAAEVQIYFGFVGAGLFRGRLCGVGLPPPCSCLPEVVAEVLGAMLARSLDNRRRLRWRDVFGLSLGLGRLGNTAGDQL